METLSRSQEARDLLSRLFFRLWFEGRPFTEEHRTMKKLLLMAALIFSGVSVAHAQNVAGDWVGTLHTGGGDLHLALHITQSNDGVYQGSMDSIDQNAKGIPLSAIALKDSNLTFEAPSVQGSYTGKVAADSNEIDGAWTQGTPLPLNFTRAKPAPDKPGPDRAKPSDIDGDWSGTLDTGSAKLRLVFHIVNTSAGLAATLDNPDQGATGIPVTTVTRKDFELKMELKQIGGVYDGKISADRSTINGTWSQGANSFPLVLKR
jgi:hypothetical protein